MTDTLRVHVQTSGPAGGAVEPPAVSVPAAGPLAVEAPAMLMDKGDLARQLRVSKKTIDRIDASGKLPRPIRIGYAKRWVRSTIVEWIGVGCPDRRTWELDKKHQHR